MELARLEEERAAEQAASKLEPHQQRVVEEKAQNDERLAKLDFFIAHNPAFTNVLIDAERLRLARQSEIMHQLSNVLGERIAAFDPVVAQREALDQITAEAQSTGEYD